MNEWEKKTELTASKNIPTNTTSIHITEETWLKFWNHELVPQEENQLLSHICECEICSSHMAEGMPPSHMLTVPAPFKTETIAYVLKHQTYRSQKLKKHHQWQLFSYSLRVSLATVAMLFVLFSFPAPNTSESRYEFIQSSSSGFTFSITAFLYDRTNSLAGKLNDFSNDLLLPSRK